MQVTKICVFVATSFIISLSIPAISFAFQNTEEKAQIDETCYKTSPERARFSFDSFSFLRQTLRQTKSLSNDLELPDVKIINEEEWQFSGKWFGFPALFTGIPSAFGACDWRPEELAFGIGMHQQIFPNIETIIWNPSIELRWYGAPNMFVGFEKRYLIPWIGDEESLALYLFVNDVEIDIDESGDPLTFYEFGHQFTRFPTDNMFFRIDYLLGLNAQRSGDEPVGFIDAQMSVGFTRLFLSIGVKDVVHTLILGNENPSMLEVAVNFSSSPMKQDGLRFFWRTFSGIEKNTIIGTPFGLWIGGEKTSGIAFSYSR